MSAASNQSRQFTQAAQQPLNSLGHTMLNLLRSEVGVMLLIGFVFVVFMSVFGKQKKGKIAQGRFGGRWEKWAAVREAQKQLRDRKSNQVTLWSGTPTVQNLWAQTKPLLLDTMPTLYLPHAQQGTIVCGAPNSGKTFSIIDPAIRSAIEQGLPIVCYDYKGSQLEAHAAYAASRGYIVHVFAPGQAYSSVINPLDFIANDGDALMARQLAVTINRNTQRFSGVKEDPFFADAGEQVVEGVFLLAKGTPYPDLAMAYSLLGLSQFSARIQAAHNEGRLDDFVKPSFQQLLLSADSEKTVAGILATANRAVSPFIKRDLLSSVCGTTSFSLDLQGKQMLFLQADLEKRDVIVPLLAAILHLVITRNFSRSRKEPLVVSLDELPTLYLPDLPKWVNEFRSLGFAPILGYQNASQLQHIYQRDLAQAIFAACGTKVIFNPRDYETAAGFSRYLGDQEVRFYSQSQSYGRNGSRSRSEQYQRCPLVSAEDFVKFGQGECIVINPAYRGHGEASVPLRLKVRLPEKDRATQRRSEELWTVMRDRLIEVVAPHHADQDSLRAALQVRQSMAERLFPLPQKQSKSEADKEEFEEFV